tara:strand:+ start:471 stop:1208 length:738 start_codon:yes stop_codon:yes gene_type:complete
MKESILITGASSGIGKALAFEFSKRGYSLGLCARRLNILDSIKNEIPYDSKIEIAKIDVTKSENISKGLHNLAKKLGNVRIVIVNAGISKNSFPGEKTFYLDKSVIETNLLGAIATIDVGVEILKKNGGGQVVGISSVAGFRGLSSNPTYSASKGALSIYMEGIRNNLAKQNIFVTVLNPGFIDTPINRHRKFRPFLISPEKAAKIMAVMIENKLLSSTVPKWPWSLVSKIIHFVPENIWAKIKF